MNGQEKKRPASLFKWIWHSYLKTALIPLVLVELVFIAIYFFTSNWSQQEMVNLLKEEVQIELQEIARRESSVIQEQLKSIANTTAMYAEQTAKALQTPAAMSSDDEKRLAYSPEGVYYTTKDKEEGGAAIFFSGIIPIGADEREKVTKVLETQELMKDILHSQPLAASIYLNTYDSLNIIYPYFDVISQYAPLMNIPTFNFYYEADDVHNPQREVKWTEAYLDPAGHGWMASAIAPVYTGDFLEGVVGIDVTVNTITNQILKLDIPWHGYGVLVGRDGMILALPESGEKDWGLSELTDHHYSEAITKNTFKPDQFNLYKRQELTDVAKQIQTNKTGFVPVTLGGVPQVISWSTVPETGWKLLILVTEQNIYSKVNQMSAELFRIGTYMIAGLILFYCIFLFVLYRRSFTMSKSISQPLLAINHMVKKIGEGQYYQQEPSFHVKELQESASLLVNMGKELGSTNESLLATQSALKKKETDLLALVSSIDDVILEVDENGVFQNIWANDYSILHIPADKVIGSSVYDVMEQEIAEIHSTVIRRVIQSGEAETIEYSLAVPKGMRWFQARIARIANEDRTASVSARDITERIVMENSLITAKEEAEKASKAKSEFLSNMSHELRTPLNAVLGFAQLLEIDPTSPLNQSQKESVKEILKAGNHLLVLINEVLDLAKIESGKLTISIEPVEIAPLMEETTSLMRPLAEKNQIKMTVISIECIQEFVAADRTRLKQVLLNIISNAIKYNRENGEVILNCEKKGGFIRFNVVDKGYGIPDSEFENIFNPFSRLKTTSNLVEGTGIGLSVAKQLVELMHGKIGVESEENVGSHFWIDIPSVEKDPRFMPSSKLLPNDMHQKGCDSSRKVVYVEDNPANLNLVAGILSHCSNITMIFAATGELGIDLARAHQPHLILMDINLPGIDGFEVLKRLSLYEETKNIPVIAISANAMPKDIEKCLKAGFSEYVTKPIQVTKFLHVLSQYLID